MKKRKLLIIDDEVDVHYSFERLLAEKPLTVSAAANGADGIAQLKKEKPDLVFLDIRMGEENGMEVLKKIRAVSPKQIVVMMTAYGTSQTAIEAMKSGAYDYVLKPFEIPALMQLIDKALEAASAMSEKVAVPGSPSEEDVASGIIGKAPEMQKVYKLIGQVAPSDATILIRGESGTGKELVARAIYSNSHRSDGIYIAINCAAIPDNLLESELFGHEKGSFTGAVSQRIGKFEQCHKGTLFLDEIGEMPIQTQSKLLRVLQEGEFTRIGSNETIKTDVRIIAATNRDLWDAVQNKEFREDLYYRLNVVNLELPPLRDRIADMESLVKFFISKNRVRTKNSPKKISDEALAALKKYRWPGNVRELENCVQRAMVLCSGETILPADLPAEVLQNFKSSAGTANPDAPSSANHPAPTKQGHSSAAPEHSGHIDQALDILFENAKTSRSLKLLPYVEREFIVRALKETGGNQVKASQILGITRATLRKRVERFGIQKHMNIE